MEGGGRGGRVGAAMVQPEDEEYTERGVYSLASRLYRSGKRLVIRWPLEYLNNTPGAESEGAAEGGVATSGNPGLACVHSITSDCPSRMTRNSESSSSYITPFRQLVYSFTCAE